MRFRVLLFLLACCFVGSAAATDSNSDFTLYLVRHAEKRADGGGDPTLTETGQQRAVYMAAWLKDKDIDNIWSSGYQRTIGTAQPLASELGLLLNIYDPSDLSALSESLMSKQNNALIVGHSNTTPELARLLCNCVIEDMDDSEYDRLIVITFRSSDVQVSTLRQNSLLLP